MDMPLKFGIGADPSTFELPGFETSRFKTGKLKTGHFKTGKLKTGLAENLGHCLSQSCQIGYFWLLLTIFGYFWLFWALFG